MMTEDMLSTDAEAYQQRRKALALTVKGLAERAGLAHRVVLKLEKGENIRPESKRRIDEALRKRAEELAVAVKHELHDATPAA